MKIKIVYAYKVIELELPMSDSGLSLRMKLEGCEDVNPVCKLLKVMDEDNPLQRLEDYVVNMDEVNYFARRMESLTDYEKEVITMYANENGLETIKDLINITFGVQGLSLITDFSSAEQVGRRLYLDEFLGTSEEEAEEINFIEFAMKTFREDTVKIFPYGVYVEHGFQMPEVYNGKTFPEYFYSDKIVMSLEIKNQSGEPEFLYLRMD